MSRWRRAWAVLPPLLLVTVPLALREQEPQAPAGAEQLIIIGPNNEAIRSEFSRAFAEYSRRELGHVVTIDWRAPGGTSEIINQVNELFIAAFRSAHPEFGPVGRNAFNDAHVDPEDVHADPEARQARRAFLASDLGIGIDLMLGGGEFDHRVNLANRGYTVDVGLRKSMPEVFRPEVIPQTLGGETIYDPKGRYVGTALSSFGICYSPDRLALCPDPEAPAPTGWMDLGLPRVFAAVAMADPSRSASVAVCYSMMIQQQLSQAVQERGGSAQSATPGELDDGWKAGFTLIKRISGNARYVTDSAQRVARDVGRGDAAIGMCIDLYGRSEAEWLRGRPGDRLRFISPLGGTAITADPISCFRGAPHRAAAVAFMRFMLSIEGQQILSYRVGEPGGPQRYALHRFPVRRDMYTPEHLQHMSDPEEDPFVLAAHTHFHAGWTAPYFDLIRSMIKACALDARPELVRAWQAIIAAGGPERVPAAMVEFSWLPVAYHDAPAAAKLLASTRLKTMRDWCIAAMDHYHAALLLAQAGR